MHSRRNDYFSAGSKWVSGIFICAQLTENLPICDRQGQWLEETGHQARMSTIAHWAVSLCLCVILHLSGKMFR